MPKRRYSVQDRLSPSFRSFTTTHITSFESLESAIKEQREALARVEMQEKMLRSKLTGEKIKYSAKKEQERSKTEKKLRAFFVQRDKVREKENHLKEEILNAENEFKQMEHKIKQVQKELHQLEHTFDHHIGSGYEQQLVDVQREKERIHKELTVLYQELQQIMGVVQGTMIHGHREKEKHRVAAAIPEKKEMKQLLDELKRTLPKLKEKKEMPPPVQVKPIKRVIVAQNPQERKEVSLLLKKIDELLIKLPEDEIKTFAESADFQLYKKIMGKYNVR